MVLQSYLARSNCQEYVVLMLVSLSPIYWQQKFVAFPPKHSTVKAYSSVASPAETMFTNRSFTAGTETSAVAQMAVRTMLMAANGKASFSGMIAATPNP